MLPKKLIETVKKRAANYALEGFVISPDVEHPTLMLVGEAPGETEIHTGVPFTGRAGKELEKMMTRANVQRDEVYITSAVRSRPYKERQKWDRKTERNEWKRYNRTPNKGEIIAHAPVLDYEIETSSPEVIVTLGNIGLKRLLGSDWSVSAAHGTVYQGPIQFWNQTKEQYDWTEKDYTVIPTFHPAAIFYNRKLLPLLEQDWDKIAIYIGRKKDA